MGLFVAIEGGDGSGKRTQTELLESYVKDTLKKDVFKISFPRYNEASSRYVGRYLDGDYGSADSVPADLGSLPYAIDRFAAKKSIEDVLAKPNGFVVADRYVASNLAHQGTKFADAESRHNYYKEMKELEYEILGIPKPDLNIVLIVPTSIAQENVDKKGDDANRSYTQKKRDIHEADVSHLERAKANYEELCVLYPDEFKAIQCVDKNGKLRSIDDIQQEIRTILKTIS
jgi:dTMP kinase